ncbi:sulfatase-like hydrolase/transferase [Planctomycetota bacterium]|nr:sulfatase-like hydrolase/transferase [Planctomycetota bacterium]MDB4453876.1 sulfatase-like hydrolase/transferase [bacterium]
MRFVLHATHSLLGLSLLGLAACGGPSAPPGAVPPTVVLISMDTVRADTLSVYGGPEGATPHLDRFAAGSTRYVSSYSSAPWTMPSHASMFTGLFPFEHGAHSFLPGPDHRGDNVFALHPRLETLAEALAAEGYATCGVVANTVYLRPGLGLDAGFQHWDVRRESGTKVTARALEWLDARAEGDRPAFLFVNYMDAHRPYATGEPDAAGHAALDGLIERVMVSNEPAGEAGLEVRALHQRAVSRLDVEVGALLDGLRTRGLLEDALVIITSDHGEAFGGHGVVEHSKDVYEDLVRVPLLVKAPGQTAGRVATERASSVDVPGLVARVLGSSEFPALSESFTRAPGNHPVVVENYYSRMRDLDRFGDRFRRRRVAIYDGSKKFIVDSAAAPELYDLVADPAELENLAERDVAAVASMSAVLDGLLGTGAFEGERVLPDQLTRQQVNEMGELGYGGGEGR